MSIDDSLELLELRRRAALDKRTIERMEELIRRWNRCAGDAGYAGSEWYNEPERIFKRVRERQDNHFFGSSEEEILLHFIAKDLGIDDAEAHRVELTRRIRRKIALDQSCPNCSHPVQTGRLCCPHCAENLDPNAIPPAGLCTP